VGQAGTPQARAFAFSHGATVKEVQRMLGHAKASIRLDRYMGVLESMQSRTDERLDAAFRELGPDPAAVAVSRCLGRRGASYVGSSTAADQRFAGGR
jgi:hypothetical protein